MRSPAAWLPDPKPPERLRYWDAEHWTANVSTNGVQSVDPLDAYKGQRWQYAVVNIGMFGAIDRMQLVFGAAGSQGWELIAIYDKSSNWFNGMEKGFMLLKRPVGTSERLSDDQWCITMSMAG
jgi:Protein of unknown function (DUF2510)